MDDGRKKQIEILRAMTPEQKLRAMTRLYWSARRLKESWLRRQHPEWTEEELRKAVNEAFLYRHD